MTTSEINALKRAADEARGLAIDAIAGCKSGHMGLPLGAAEIGAALFGRCLNVAPAHPKWINRDRFVLSAGHGSMFSYAWLHLAGFGISMDDVKAFRKRGYEVLYMTDPVDEWIVQDIYNYQEKQLRAVNRGDAPQVSASDNLILFFDSNDVTLDAPAAKTQSEDVMLRFEAAGWDAWLLEDGHDVAELVRMFEAAKTHRNGRPKIIVCKTLIGKGVPEVAGTTKAHGEGGAKFAAEARRNLGLPEERFFVSAETRAYFSELAAKREAAYAEWEKTCAAWKSANPELAALLEKGVAGDFGSAEELLAQIPEFGANENATRVSGEASLNALAKNNPLMIAGAADLFSSVKTYIKEGGDFDVATPAGRNVFYGIREHAMAAITNGIGYYGIFKPMASTFLTFIDYARGAVRVSALAKLPVYYVLTHDSVAVGEDGPTHQPVELVSALRCIPNLDVIRPGDSEETAAAYAYAVARRDGPVALCLSRQNVPSLETIPASVRRAGTLRGAYVAVKETAPLERIIIATGSELRLAVAAAEKLGAGTRVVSMPSMEIFDRQPAAYREEVLPASCANRVAIEAGVTAMWWKYVGLSGKVIGTDTFGFSAPGPVVLEAMGISTDNLVAQCR